MEDQSQSQSQPRPTKSASSSSSSTQPPQTEPARSRWTPKPEQILILESIFNSGNVNPSKDDTMRIRRLLEKFGPVGDANVFYWFQNRRSRSRRRQRQLQAAALQSPPPSPGGGGAAHHLHQYSNTASPENLGLNINYNNIINMRGCQLAPSSSTEGQGQGEGVYGFDSTEATSAGGGVFSISAIPPQNSSHDPNPSLLFHPPSGGGIITVFVNGVATQVPAGSFDVKAVFGQYAILVHSTGVPVPVDNFGFCYHGLLHGETYFLVPRVA